MMVHFNFFYPRIRKCINLSAETESLQAIRKTIIIPQVSTGKTQTTTQICDKEDTGMSFMVFPLGRI